MNELNYNNPTLYRDIVIAMGTSKIILRLISIFGGHYRCITCLTTYVFSHDIFSFSDVECPACIRRIRNIVESLYNTHRILQLCKLDAESTIYKYLLNDIINEINRWTITHFYHWINDLSYQ